MLITLDMLCHEMGREHEWVYGRDSIETCCLCGLVSDEPTYCYLEASRCRPDGGNGRAFRDSFSLPAIDCMPGRTYISRYHTNERLAQVIGNGPPIPDQIMDMIWRTYHQGLKEGRWPEADQLTKKHISEICRTVEVPAWAQEEFRSKTQRKNPFTSCYRYADRWYEIRERLGGSNGLIPDAREMVLLKHYCEAAKQQWNYVRHEPGCPPGGAINCHKVHGCRKNFPPTCYVMRQICLLLGFEHLLHLFPVDTKQGTVDNLNKYWKKICQRTMWNYKPLTVQAAN